ncbi:MAG: protein phosphatase [Firmicutes bacterium]|nr:protein phosphatase [Bacillota bacterium]
MISVFGITDRGVLRSQNQDCCAYEGNGQDRAWGVVCDGMGGAKAGDIASRIGIEVFREYMTQKAKESEPEKWGELLREAVEKGNHVIHHCAMTDRDCQGMGTTLVGAFLEKEVATVINVGDSRAYHINEQGINRVTRDHSIVEALVARGSITPEQARVHPQKNLITRALGTSRTVESDVYETTLKIGDWLLLCSDGLINEMRDDEIHQAVIGERDPEAACTKLLDIALAREASDNVTILAFRLEAPEEKE